MQPHVEHSNFAALFRLVLLHVPHLFFKGAFFYIMHARVCRQHIVVTVKVWPIAVSAVIHGMYSVSRTKRRCVFGLPYAPGSLLLNVDGVNQRPRMVSLLRTRVGGVTTSKARIRDCRIAEVK